MDETLSGTTVTEGVETESVSTEKAAVKKLRRKPVNSPSESDASDPSAMQNRVRRNTESFEFGVLLSGVTSDKSGSRESQANFSRSQTSSEDPSHSYDLPPVEQKRSLPSARRSVETTAISDLGKPIFYSEKSYQTADRSYNYSAKHVAREVSNASLSFDPPPAVLPTPEKAMGSTRKSAAIGIACIASIVVIGLGLPRLFSSPSPTANAGAAHAAMLPNRSIRIQPSITPQTVKKHKRSHHLISAPAVVHETSGDSEPRPVKKHHPASADVVPHNVAASDRPMKHAPVQTAPKRPRKSTGASSSDPGFGKGADAALDQLP